MKKYQEDWLFELNSEHPNVLHVCTQICNDDSGGVDELTKRLAEIYLQQNSWTTENPPTDGKYLCLCDDGCRRWEEVLHFKTHHYSRFLSNKDYHSDFEHKVVGWKNI